MIGTSNKNFDVLILALFLFVLLVLPLAVSTFSEKHLDYRVTFQPEIEALSSKTEWAAFGSSHAFVGVFPNEFSSEMVNLAVPGLDYMTMGAVVKSNLPKIPNLRLALVEFDAILENRNSIEKNKNDHSKLWNVNVKPWYLQVSRLKEARLILEWIQWSLSYEIYRSRAAFEKMLTKSPAGLPGYHPLDGQLSKDISGESRIKTHLSHRREAKMDLLIHRKALLETIKLLLAKRIITVLVHYPHHPSYWKHWPTEFETSFRDSISEIDREFFRQKKPVYFWDYGRSDMFTDEDFKDPNHLNKVGALKFSRLLNQKINELLNSGKTSIIASSLTQQ